MTTTNGKQEQTMQEQSPTDFHGAAIINSEGQEIPITEEMIQRACEEFEETWNKS